MDIPKTWMYYALDTGLGILGNAISVGVLLAPVPTFIRIYRNKSSGDYQSLPYLVALFSASVWLYLGFNQTDVILLISINSLGCVMEAIYIIVYILFAPRNAKRSTLTLLAAMNGGLFAVIFLVMQFAITKNNRVTVLGWVCTVVSTCVYVAPLNIVVQVVRTKSVEYMPFALTMCLTVNAAVWSLYGLFKDMYQDVNVLFPNIIGFILGIFQMCMYLFYSRAGSQAVDIETGGGQLEDRVALGGAGPVLEAVGDGVIELVEDGGRLIELPAGGGVGRTEEGSGSGGKVGKVGEGEGGGRKVGEVGSEVVEGGSGDREDGGGGDREEGGGREVGKVGEGGSGGKEGGGDSEVGSEVVEGGSGDKEDGGGTDGKEGGGGDSEVVEGGSGDREGGGGGDGEEGGGGEGEEGSRGERAESVEGEVAEEGGGEVVKGGDGDGDGEDGGNSEVAGGVEVVEGDGGGEGEETSEVVEGGGGSEGEESGKVAEMGGAFEGKECIGGGVAEGAGSSI